MRKIKRDDEVIVLAGKDKGKRGKIQMVRDDGRLIVTGINMVKRHTKPNPNMGVTGGIIEKEAAIDASNVGIFNPETSKADRVAIKTEGDKKIRVFKSSGAAIDA